MSELYIPDRGHIVLLNFHPSKGLETGKRRPALILSSEKYNQQTGLVICCPVSSSVKKRVAEVAIQLNKPSNIVPGLIRTMDWQQRKAEFITEVSAGIYIEVLQKLLPLIGANLLLESASESDDLGLLI